MGRWWCGELGHVRAGVGCSLRGFVLLRIEGVQSWVGKEGGRVMGCRTAHRQALEHRKHRWPRLV